MYDQLNRFAMECLASLGAHTTDTVRLIKTFEIWAEKKAHCTYYILLCFHSIPCLLFEINVKRWDLLVSICHNPLRIAAGRMLNEKTFINMDTIQSRMHSFATLLFHQTVYIPFFVYIFCLLCLACTFCYEFFLAYHTVCFSIIYLFSCVYGIKICLGRYVKVI